MPLPVIVDVVRAAVRGTCPSGQRWINVHHLRKIAGAPWLAGDFTTIDPLLRRLYSGAAFGAGIPWMSSCVAAVTLDDISYTPLDGTSPTSVITAGLAGGAAGTSLPSEVAAVLTLRTNLRGRSHRGRVYLPPVSTGTVSAGGIIPAANVTGEVAQAGGMSTALVAAGYWPCVASYLLHTSSDITSYTMDNRFDVQRGRK